MASVFTIEPNPHWVIIDNFSKLPNGAAIYTYRSRNPTEFKPAFQDAGGNVPYGEFIQGFGNGTMPPIFWEFNDAAPDEGYYIRVYDRPKDQPGAQFLWDFDGLFGGSAGGGGGTVTTLIDIENLVVNGQFFRNCGDISNPGTLVTIAPGNNAGFAGKANNPSDGPVDGDIIFAKNNTSATDSISFVPVSPPGSQNIGSNPTPAIYVNYTASIAGAGETYKFFQFPLVTGLQNTSGQSFGVRFFARLNGGNANVNLIFRQFFGNGSNSPSNDVQTIIGGGPLALDPGVWKQFSFTAQAIPSIAGQTTGNCGNDALYLQLAMPLSPEVIDIDFILPSVYIGGVSSSLDFHTLDQIDSITNTPRTGDIRTSINSIILGWVRMDDGTIGNATSNSTSRANIDTFPLFKLIWDTFQSSQSLAPMFTSAGAPVAYGADAEADFAASRQLALTKSLGRVMAGAVPGVSTQAFTRAGNNLTVTSSAGFYTGMAVTVSGGGLPAPLVAGTIYYAIIVDSTNIRLATTTANALAGTFITLTTAGTGTVVSVNAETLGSYGGEERHPLLITEIPAHTHTYNALANPGGVIIQGGTDYFIQSANTGSTGGAGSTSTGGTGQPVIPHNIVQPTAYVNIFVKL